MILKLYNCDNDTIDWSLNKVWIIEACNKTFFIELLSFLKNIDCLEDKFNILLGNKSINRKDILVISEIIDFGVENKTIINKLYKKIENDIFLDYENKLKLNNLYDKIKMYIDNIISKYNFFLQYETEIKIKDFLSFVNLLPTNDDSTYFDKILNFISINAELQLFKLICFVNLKDYLTNEELVELYRFCLYNKTEILLIETKKCSTKLEYESKFYIDEDLFDLIY